ncbi:MAG: hypothetical protein KVP17_004690 [Porospora cf. gigantea B]|uniref:uncharacterized protein n=1 Tax=Porospora cf. gigantea B TaxID=2853592 RepID=UPI0035719022|nr:MAG: hypothetical protein KVP17_004690 [Porospora cf. gigantea B]
MPRETDSPKEEYFHHLEKVGEGTYGEVFKAQDYNGCTVALKKIRPPNKDEGIPSTAIREISLLKELDHINIVRLFDVIHRDNELTLVFEYLDQDLKRLIDTCDGREGRPRGLHPTAIRSFMFQLVSGVEYCHHHKVLHRDLKPQNLLINREGYLKLCDFGLARAYGIPVESYTHEVVTLWYRSPDVLMGSDRYSTPLDIWSVGCIFGEMVTGKPLFSGMNEAQMLQSIYSKLGTPTLWTDMELLPNVAQYTSLLHPPQRMQPFENLFPTLDPQGRQLLKSMLAFDPNKRITAREALAHPYFDTIRLRNDKPC